MQSEYQEPGTPPSTGGVARGEAQATAGQVRTGVGEVAGTAQQQAGQVVQQVGTEARRVIDRTRGRLNDETQAQTRRTAEGIRQWSDELASMAESAKPDSPVRDAVHQIADSGRRAADYLDQRGLDGVVGELQNFARRRPGTFLLGAAVAGFLVGRTAKAAASSTEAGSMGGGLSSSTEAGSMGGLSSQGRGQEPVSFDTGTEDLPTTTQPAPPTSYQSTPSAYPTDTPRPGPASPPTSGLGGVG